MTKEEVIRLINPRTADKEIKKYNCGGFGGWDNMCKAMLEARKLAAKMLEHTTDKDCSQCLDKGHCAIHDNFNIDYCSDWRNV